MSKVYIIAEAGVNHNGDINIAAELVRQAAKAGADAVKFQTFSAKALTTDSAQKADYQKKTTDSEESQQDMLSRLELSREDHIYLQKLCKECNIDFLSTPFDQPSIELLEELSIPVYKIPSGEITNYPHLVNIARLKKPVILSTGMCFMEDVEKAVAVLKENGAEDITLLHCTTEYPAPKNEVNLRAMITLRDKFNLKVGYSDHTQGIEIPIAAVGMGAMLIEKHFTLDKNMEGPDHKASLEPYELKAMVDAIRNVEAALGSGIKEPTESEKRNMAIARKSLVAAADIAEGEPFSAENLTAKRPGNGISPMEWSNVIGKTAKRDFKRDELIEI